MDSDRAYLLGLIIGGGIFGNSEDVFRIRLPYKKWGSYIENPKRAGQIAKDILQKVSKIFMVIFNLSVQYETTKEGIWTILCEGDLTELKKYLRKYKINCSGEIRGEVDLEPIIAELIDDNLKRRFIAGLADTIGSIASSHRRFSDEHQIISLEIKGTNFDFVCKLCQLLYSINCIVDQINWNHPNIHCTNDPYYSTWNKGFKLRILLDQYTKFGAFVFRTKAEGSDENRRLQHSTHSAESCETRDINISPSCIHPAENDKRLPEIIRGGHYIHFRHFCAVLGCIHAPYKKLEPYFSNIGNYINPFPILHKGTEDEIRQLIANEPLLRNRLYRDEKIKLTWLVKQYENNNLIFGNGGDTGYPVSAILQGIAYIIANENELYGKRPSGKFISIIVNRIKQNINSHIVVRIPDILTPLVIIDNGRGALIGPQNPNVYKKLVKEDPNYKYKLITRKITENDLK